MAIYHFHVGHISRGSGASAVAAAAYRAGEELTSEYYGKKYDYTRKSFYTIMSRINDKGVKKANSKAQEIE